MSLKFCLGAALQSLALMAITVNADQSFNSGAQKVSLLELYTSQGCSSCPPLEDWLSHFTDEKQLWKRVVPVAFHVTYWDYLGWQDAFGSSLYDRRQRDYAQFWRNRSGVYTPGVVLNGEEWRGWMNHTDLSLAGPAESGNLHVELKPESIGASFESGAALPPVLQLNIALLGFGIDTPIKAGENAHQVLHHDFVVLDYRQESLKGAGGRYKGQFPALAAGSRPAKRLALAAWVSGTDDPTPLQATGGWLIMQDRQALAH